MANKTKQTQSKGEKRQLPPDMTVNVDNGELVSLVEAYAKDNSVDNLNRLLNHLTKCRVLLPAMVNDSKAPAPCLLKDNQNVSYLPIYTDKTQIPDHVKTDGIMNMPYLAANRTVAQQKERINGIVINPFTHNLIFRLQLIDRIEEVEKNRKSGGDIIPRQQKIKLTDEQYVQFERRQYEVGYLPKKLFSEGQKFMDTLISEKEAYIDRLYEDSYKEKRMYPYIEEDFSVMVLSITEEFLVVRVDMPARDMAPGLVYRIYVTWKPQTRTAGYFRLTMGKGARETLLEEVSPDLKLISHGKAPEEGMELQTIIDLAGGKAPAEVTGEGE